MAAGRWAAVELVVAPEVEKEVGATGGVMAAVAKAVARGVATEAEVREVAMVEVMVEAARVVEMAAEKEVVMAEEGATAGEVLAVEGLAGKGAGGEVAVAGEDFKILSCGGWCVGSRSQGRQFILNTMA